MSPPKELPGFYYDSEKNRYFPIKGPIPGSNKRPKSDPCSSSSSSNKEPKFHVIRSGKTLKASKLINLREIQGRDIFSNSKRCLFRDQYEKLQASQPMVWKYEPNKPVADGALELVYGTIESLNGSKDVVLLATGGTDGKISFFEMRNSSSEDSDADYRQTEILANPIWPHADLLPNRASSIWRLNLMRHALVFPSETSCIKCSPLSSHKHAFMVTALKGLVCMMDLSQLGSRSEMLFVRNFECTIWGADFNSDGAHAVLGTSKGATLLNVETRSSTWIYRSKSDVLSQQYACSGNVVLCGLRNGLIHVIDTRENSQNRSDRRRNSSRRNENNNKGQNSSNSVRMSSAVCGLVSLKSDENYFLGSSMDGSIKLFDMRALKNGGVQSYEGHVNSHTRLQLAVNPSETLFLSGGQDCGVRIWSIKSGELLFSEKFSDSVFTTACWPDLEGLPNLEDRFNLGKSCGAWLGSRSSLSYVNFH